MFNDMLRAVLANDGIIGSIMTLLLRKACTHVCITN